MLGTYSHSFETRMKVIRDDSLNHKEQMGSYVIMGKGNMAWDIRCHDGDK